MTHNFVKRAFFVLGCIACVLYITGINRYTVQTWYNKVCEATMNEHDRFAVMVTYISDDPWLKNQLERNGSKGVSHRAIEYGFRTRQTAEETAKSLDRKNAVHHVEQVRDAEPAFFCK